MNYSGYGPGIKRIWLVLLSVLFAYWLAFAPGISQASEMPQSVKIHAVEDTKLQMLDDKLTQQRQVLGKLANESMALRAELKQSQMALRKALEECEKLKSELAEVRSLSDKQINSLKNANQLLEASARKVKREKLRIKAQRNTWEVVSCGLLVALAKK